MAFHCKLVNRKILEDLIISFSILVPLKKIEISICFLSILKLKVFDSDIDKQRKPVSYLLIYGRPGEVPENSEDLE